ncbi:MAG: YjbQ family protein [Firmicutes bacterium]|nr:YjbQ family protein [Bacillota bacterium]
MIKVLEINTEKKTQFIDITNKIQNAINKNKILNGICEVFIPHTTAGITINENADPDVKRDMIMGLEKIVPFNDEYKHIEGNSAAHIKSSLMGFSESIIIDQGKLLLGTWQGIYFCEFDGPRKRKIIIKTLK